MNETLQNIEKMLLDRIDSVNKRNPNYYENSLDSLSRAVMALVAIREEIRKNNVDNTEQAIVK